MKARFAVGARLQCWSWIARGLTGALLMLAACSRPRNTQPDRNSFNCQAPAPRGGESFGSAMQAAMARMNDAMNAGFSADSDREFAAMMIPHHQGAVDMAVLELRFGRHEQLRRLAAGIIVEQRAEIELMQQILNESRAPNAAPPMVPQNQVASQL